MKPKKKYVGLKTSSGKTTKNPFETLTWQALDDNPLVSATYESVQLPYSTEHKYIPDFMVTRDDGSTFYIETKGNGRSWTSTVRKKMLAVRDQHPSCDIRFLFYSDGEFGTRRKDGSRQRQSEWANKHGFPYAIRDIPKEWLID